MAVLGVFESARRSGISLPHIVTTKIEHPAVLEACHEVERRGGEVTYLPVSEDGLVSPKDLESALKKETVLVSVMFANNEIGTIQPIAEIGKVIKIWREKNRSDFPYFHSDACQAILYEKIDVAKLGLDLLTLDGIKMYGPRGVGILFQKLSTPLSPIIFGGGQEKGLRSGTENLPAVVGLAKAFEIAEKMRQSESARLCEIRDYAIEKILKNFPQAKVNGSFQARLPSNLNICFPGADSEFLVVALDVEGIALSHSSTCRTLKEDSSSYVVEALGRKDCSGSSLRITLGHATSKKDIDTLIVALNRVLNLV
jgi:cysteine desulfurase